MFREVSAKTNELAMAIVGAAEDASNDAFHEYQANRAQHAHDCLNQERR